MAISKNLFIHFLLISQIVTIIHGFVTIQKPRTFLKSQCNTQKYLFEPYSSILSSDLIISTIDADIANISDNEFKTVFLGGIVVMFGGLISTAIVGIILKTTNGYGRVIAESYPEEAGGEEAFLNGLPEEEREEARELLRKLREQKNEGKKDVKVAAVQEDPEKNETEKDIFSDY